MLHSSELFLNYIQSPPISNFIILNWIRLRLNLSNPDSIDFCCFYNLDHAFDFYPVWT